MTPQKKTEILNKFSSVFFRQYFNLSNNKQVSSDFQNPIKVKQIEDYLLQRIIIFRDACLDPTVPENEAIIRDHHMYINDPTNRFNAQARGFQCDIANNIFRDCAIAGNGITTTSMSAFSLSSDSKIDLTKVKSSPDVIIPKAFHIPGLSSFKQAGEIDAANLVSAVQGNQVILTNDSFIKIPKNFKVVNDLPKTQNFGDACVINNNTKTAVFIDFKHTNCRTSICRSASIIPGALSEKEERKALSLIASNAKTDVINNSKTKVRHLDSQKDNIYDKVNELNNVIKTTDVKEQSQLIGLGAVYSNRFFLKPKYNYYDNDVI